MNSFKRIRAPSFSKSFHGQHNPGALNSTRSFEEIANLDNADFEPHVVNTAITFYYSCSHKIDLGYIYVHVHTIRVIQPARLIVSFLSILMYTV